MYSDRCYDQVIKEGHDPTWLERDDHVRTQQEGGHPEARGAFRETSPAGTSTTGVLASRTVRNVFVSHAGWHFVLATPAH